MVKMVNRNALAKGVLKKVGFSLRESYKEIVTS